MPSAGYCSVESGRSDSCAPASVTDRNHYNAREPPICAVLRPTALVRWDTQIWIFCLVVLVADSPERVFPVIQYVQQPQYQ
jgi:hypothetical protein